MLRILSNFLKLLHSPNVIITSIWFDSGHLKEVLQELNLDHDALRHDILMTDYEQNAWMTCVPAKEVVINFALDESGKICMNAESKDKIFNNRLRKIEKKYA